MGRKYGLSSFLSFFWRPSGFMLYVCSGFSVFQEHLKNKAYMEDILWIAYISARSGENELLQLNFYQYF